MGQGNSELSINTKAKKKLIQAKLEIISRGSLHLLDLPFVVRLIQIGLIFGKSESKIISPAVLGILTESCIFKVVGKCTRHDYG